MYTVYSPSGTAESGLASIGWALVMWLQGYQPLERGQLLVSQATQWVFGKDSQSHTLFQNRIINNLDYINNIWQCLCSFYHGPDVSRAMVMWPPCWRVTHSLTDHLTEQTRIKHFVDDQKVETGWHLSQQLHQPKAYYRRNFKVRGLCQELYSWRSRRSLLFWNWSLFASWQQQLWYCIW